MNGNQFARDTIQARGQGILRVVWRWKWKKFKDEANGKSGVGRIRRSKRCLFCPSGGEFFAQVLEGKKKKAEKCISQQQHFLDARLHDFFCATAADTMQTSQLGTSWNLHMHTVNKDAQFHCALCFSQSTINVQLTISRAGHCNTLWDCTTKKVQGVHRAAAGLIMHSLQTANMILVMGSTVRKILIQLSWKDYNCSKDKTEDKCVIVGVVGWEWMVRTGMMKTPKRSYGKWE